MSGKVRILCLVFVAALVVLFARLSLGQGKGTKDPCGGHYVGYGLKALFSDSYQYGEEGPTYYGSIINDVPGLCYQYLVPGGDCVFLFRNGHIIVSPHTSVDETTHAIIIGRYANMKFVGPPTDPQPTSPPCGNAYFLDGTGNPVQLAEFILRTASGYTGSTNDNGELVLTAMGINPDLYGMSDGEILYCDVGGSFRVANNLATESYDEYTDSYLLESRPASILCEYVNGKQRWTFRPIPVSFWQRVVTKTKKTVTVNEYPNENSMYRKFWSNGRSSCCHGTFYFPFELIVERL